METRQHRLKRRLDAWSLTCRVVCQTTSKVWWIQPTGYKCGQHRRLGFSLWACKWFRYLLRRATNPAYLLNGSYEASDPKKGFTIELKWRILFALLQLISVTTAWRSTLTCLRLRQWRSGIDRPQRVLTRYCEILPGRWLGNTALHGDSSIVISAKLQKECAFLIDW